MDVYLLPLIYLGRTKVHACFFQNIEKATFPEFESFVVEQEEGSGNIRLSDFFTPS